MNLTLKACEKEISKFREFHWRMLPNTYRKKLMPILHHIFYKIQGCVSNIWWGQHCLNIKGKTKIESHRLIFLMNLNVKILHKTSANWIQQCMKMIIHHEQEGFIPDKWHLKINQCNLPYWQVKEEKSHYCINWCRESFWQNTILIHEKNCQQIRTGEGLITSW